MKTREQELILALRELADAAEAQAKATGQESATLRVKRQNARRLLEKCKK